MTADFFRELQRLTTRIHATRNIDEIMLDLSGDICTLFGADRLTIYTIGDDNAGLVSKVKTGLSSFQQLHLPISAQSLAGYCALSRSTLNIADVYDETSLAAIAPDLQFQQGVDRRTGYRTQEMLVSPIMHDQAVSGVVQLINNLRGGPFEDIVVQGLRDLCDTLAIAFSQRSNAAPPERARFIAAIPESALTRAQREQAERSAVATGSDIEDILLNEIGLKTGVVGRALANFYNVPYLAFHPERRKPGELLANFNREYAERHQWLPVEESKNGLYLLCTDPHAARHGGEVTRLFPHSRPVYCVTTRREFGWMLNQFFGPPGAAKKKAAPTALPPELHSRLMEAVRETGAYGLLLEADTGADQQEIRFRVSGSFKLG